MHMSRMSLLMLLAPRYSSQRMGRVTMSWRFFGSNCARPLSGSTTCGSGRYNLLQWLGCKQTHGK